MRSIIHYAITAGLLVIAGAAGCSKSESPSTQPSAGAAPNGAGAYTIAVIPKGTTHSYWKSVEAGAHKAGAELGVKINYKGPLREDDRAEQIKVVEQFVSEGVSAIVVAPLDDTAMVRPVRSAAEHNIPVVVFDSALKADLGKDYIAYVATDNRAAGAIAGEELARLLNNKGKVVLLRYAEGSASTHDREEGFLGAIARHPELTVIQQDRYAGATAAESQNASMQLVDKLNEADGIFCPNESSTQGMLVALEQLQLAGKKKFVGFDASKPLLDALKKGEIDALVSQNPLKMGYESVKAAVAKLKGEPFQTNIDTGAQLITRDNLSQPAIQELIGTQ